uniref:Uncharacterized protein n=1 Tax=Pleurostomum flabellatum TaxID=405751 RepID=A0A7T0Q4Z8_9EUKA|nr:hypothetical protein J6731_mgp18 [Pleurostomum flabellatum]QPL15636.1 hypothetical protein [Pleurostomum flabellatum]
MPIRGIFLFLTDRWKNKTRQDVRIESAGFYPAGDRVSFVGCRIRIFMVVGMTEVDNLNVVIDIV